jgi:hypothetical protein
MTHFEKMRPVNHGYRRGIAALLQSFADKPSEETKRQLARFLPPKVLRTLTTERARELAEKTREKREAAERQLHQQAGGEGARSSQGGAPAGDERADTRGAD